VTLDLPHPDADLLASVQGTLSSVWQQALGSADQVVLLDYPAHTNVGDAAIWLGERQLLRQLDKRLVHVGSFWETDLDAVESAAEAGATVLLHGGGSFGDVWPRLQEHRESVLERCRGKRVVQLAQTVHFRDDARRDTARRAFESHGDVVLLARDARSLEYLRQWFDVPSLLCPDAAMALGDLRQRRRSPDRDVLVLGRTDREDAGDEWPADAQPVDWLQDDPAPVLTRLSRLHRAVAPTLGERAVQKGRLRLYDAWARHRVDRGVRQLSLGRAVATDRLHAHVLSLLLGIPHAVSDNDYGKLSGYLDAWTGGSLLAERCSSKDAALAAARGRARAVP
jgi:exopolysaccharide biosynthesis predicted pyruvyltransferase EpsI